MSVHAGKIDKRFPDFFIIGAPKCGTTSLHAWLAEHPRLYLPVKEPGFFSDDILPSGRTLEEYLALFGDVPAGEVLIGEASPKYLYSDKGMENLAAFNPSAKIIIALRPPADLVVSFHAQMIKEGVEDEADLQKAWALAEKRLAGTSLPSLCPSAELLNYPHWGRIGSSLQNAVRIFGEQRILVVLLEDIESEPSMVYRRILDHLGITDDGRTEFPALNPRRSIRFVSLHRAALAFRSGVMPLLSRVHRLRNGRGLGLLKAIGWLNQAPIGARLSPPSEFAESLRAWFDGEVSIVERLLDRDLSHWRKRQ